MKDIEFLGVTIVFDGNAERGIVDLGSITLKSGEREYKLDIETSLYTFANGQTTIECEVDEAKDIFGDECKYDLTKEDLYNLDVAEIFISGECDEPEHQTLFVRSGGVEGCTRAIDLTLE